MKKIRLLAGNVRSPLLYIQCGHKVKAIQIDINEKRTHDVISNNLLTTTSVQINNIGTYLLVRIFSSENKML